MILLRCLGLAAALALCPGAAAWAQASRSPLPSLSASAESGGPRWETLSPRQREVLAPLKDNWADLNAARKAKWLEVAAKFPSMPEAEQARIRERMAEWSQLTPAERGHARLSFQESKQLSSEEKQKRWEAYQALSDEERSALASRAKQAGSSTAAARPATAAQPAAGAQPAKPAASAAAAPLVKPIAPTLVQAKPGATTNLMTQPAKPPAHQQPGQPTIAAKPGLVDSHTLLPRRGPQAASASAPSRP